MVLLGAAMNLGELVDTGRTTDDGRKIYKDTSTGELVVFRTEVTSDDGGAPSPLRPAMPLWGWIALSIAGIAGGGAVTYFIVKRSKRRRR